MPVADFNDAEFLNYCIDNACGKCKFVSHHLARLLELTGNPKYKNNIEYWLNAPTTIVPANKYEIMALVKEAKDFHIRHITNLGVPPWAPLKAKAVAT